MMPIREARIKAGLSMTEMCKMFELPKRTLENWELCYAIPPKWAEKLIIEKLNQIADEKADKEREGI